MEKEKQNFFEITVKVVIVNDKNEILIIKRSKDNDTAAGKYDLPGGRLEAGEDIKKGLLREIGEELGIEARIEAVLTAFDFGHKYDNEYEIGGEKLLVSGKGLRFLARYQSGEIKLSGEHEKYEWLEMEKALARFGDNDFEADKKEAVKKAQEYLEMKGALDNWKRAVADFENYKKRQAEGQKELIAFSNINLILAILPVLDNFYVSINHIPEEQKKSPWVTGIMHIQKQLEAVLKDFGTAEIKVIAGDKFDPAIHEALENKDCPPEKCKNIIKQIVQKGYKIEERVIRPARVIVE